MNEQERARIEARIKFLQRNRPKDKEIATLQAKLKTASDEAPVVENPTITPLGQLEAPVVEKIKDGSSGYAQDVKSNDYEANKNIAINNPTIQNPFGKQEVIYDANGNPVVNQTLEEGQQEIVNRDTELSTMGRNYAKSLAGQGGLTEQFDPQLDRRLSSGDLIADRQRQEKELTDYLSRDLDSQYAKERDSREQQLYNRGIPLDPNAQQYKDQMRELDDTFARARGDIRAQALQFGGTEMDRTYGMNEKTIANQLSQGQAIRNQRLGEIGSWSQFGTGAQIPQFQQYQGYNYNVANPTDLDIAYKTLQQGNRQLNIADRNSRPSGGGARTGGSAIAQSPFVE